MIIMLASMVSWLSPLRALFRDVTRLLTDVTLHCLYSLLFGFSTFFDSRYRSHSVIYAKLKLSNCIFLIRTVSKNAAKSAEPCLSIIWIFH